METNRLIPFGVTVGSASEVTAQVFRFNCTFGVNVPSLMYSESSLCFKGCRWYFCQNVLVFRNERVSMSVFLQIFFSVIFWESEAHNLLLKII